jgi:signal transduction histidine kinase
VTLQGAVVAVIGAERGDAERLAAPLRALGAIASTALVHVDAMATLSAPGFDAVVLDVGFDPERFAPLAAALRGDARTQSTPLVGIVDAGLAIGRVAPLALSRVVTSADERDLPGILESVVELRRVAAASANATRDLDERLRVALDRLAAIRADSQAMTHDARVLCGIVLGFAANMRDGVVGSLEDVQRSHIRQIIDAANDTAAILERFGGEVRDKAALSGEPPPTAHRDRRATRRTLLDLCELSRTSAAAFATMSAQKGLTLVLDAPTPVSLWGDALQVKQVIVNLLVNALKFTPAGGRVTLSVRPASPAGAPHGVAARTHAELAVIDTGPGIPAPERERIFDRGVRLSRDDSVPGNGLGLAVAREIVTGHGGDIRAEETAGGGATLLVTLPIDMRTRREQRILLVDDPDAARRIVAVLSELRERSVEAVREANGAISAALGFCRAVVVVPHAPSAALNDLLGPARKPEVTNR